MALWIVESFKVVFKKLCHFLKLLKNRNDALWQLHLILKQP